MDRNHRNIRALRIVFSALFCLLLVSPILQGALGIVDLPGVSENRNLATLPDIAESSFGTFPAAMDTYLNDNYGFRRFMIKVANSLRLYVFRVKRIGNVIIGRDDWLFFYSDTDGDTIADYKKTNRLTHGQLRNLADLLTMKEITLSRLGIRLVIILVPNKGTVYPEYLPGHLQVEGESRYDQVSSFIRRNTGLNVIDVKAALLRAKDEYGTLLYEPNGSHWNALGAFVGYRAVIEQLRKTYPALSPRDLSEYEIRHKKEKQHLENMLGVFGYESMVQPSLYFRGEKVKSHRFNTDDLLDRTVLGSIDTQAGSLPRTVIFRDSFFNGMQPFMESHLSSAVLYRWHDGILNNSVRVDEIIAGERPRLVIVEVVERVLYRLSLFAQQG